MNRFRGESSGPSERADTSRQLLDHRVIDPGDDVAIVEYEQIGNTGKPVEGVLVRGADRFTADIAAGHYQGGRAIGMRKEQVMQRGIGQHHTNIAHPRGQVRGQR